jgi:hypothetical protein
MTLAHRILQAVEAEPGITDRRLAELIFGPGAAQQRVNGECRLLADRGLLERARRLDGLIGNSRKSDPVGLHEDARTKLIALQVQTSEDELKTALKAWLEADGWEVEVAWAKSRGVDLHARRGSERWIIEAKGCGSLNAMRVNYFLGVLGETLQRMNDTEATYSIALPDLKQFRSLWARLPALAKERTQISALFVRDDGRVELCHD